MMKINTSNYFEQIAKVKVSDFPEALKNGHDLALQAAEDGWEAYNDATIKRVVDLYFEKLEAYLSTQAIKGKRRKTTAPKTPEKVSFKTGAKIRAGMKTPVVPQNDKAARLQKLRDNKNAKAKTKPKYAKGQHITVDKKDYIITNIVWGDMNEYLYSAEPVDKKANIKAFYESEITISKAVKDKPTTKPKPIDKPVTKSKPKYRKGQSVIVDGWIYKIASSVWLKDDYKYTSELNSEGKHEVFYEAEIQKVVPAAKYKEGQSVWVDGEIHKIIGNPMWSEGEGDEDGYMYTFGDIKKPATYFTFYETEIQKVAAAKELNSKSKISNTEKLSAEIRFIKRYVNLHDKTKTQAQIQAFIRDLQKSITDRQIPKTSKYAAEVMNLQEGLIKANNSFSSPSSTLKITLNAEVLDKMTAIAKGEVVFWEVYYGRRIVGLQGKETKAKAEKLKKEIDVKVKAGVIKESHKSYHNFKKLYGKLVAYLENSTKIDITEQELYGLNGISTPKSAKKKA